MGDQSGSKDLLGDLLFTDLNETVECDLTGAPHQEFDITSVFSSKETWCFDEYFQSNEEVFAQRHEPTSLQTHNATTSSTTSAHLHYLELDTEQSIMLMDYFFETVAPMFCCYDGGKNPFYHVIGKAWHSELRYAEHAALIWACQSIAASFLLKDTPGLRPVAQYLQKQVQSHLDQISVLHGYDANSVLALILF